MTRAWYNKWYDCSVGTIALLWAPAVQLEESFPCHASTAPLTNKASSALIASIIPVLNLETLRELATYMYVRNQTELLFRSAQPSAQDLHVQEASRRAMRTSQRPKSFAKRIAASLIYLNDPAMRAQLLLQQRNAGAILGVNASVASVQHNPAAARLAAQAHFSAHYWH